jgi:septum formation protein
LVNQELICLASASPRRAVLLEQIGLSYVQKPVDIDETVLPGESPVDFVRRVALEKATAAWRDGGDGALTLAADTAVVLEGEIFGKPTDAADAAAKLGRLSGRTHEVLTAVAAVLEGERDCVVSRSRVSFRRLADSEIERYVATGEPLDKAGAYGIQGLAAIFVERLEGSFSGVMGLPLCETAALLDRFGIDVLTPAVGLPA